MKHAKKGIIRYDVMALGVIFLLLAISLYLIPVKTSTVLTSDSFFAVGRSGWYTAGEIVLPAGDSLYISFSSDLPVTVGFANATSWILFANGHTSTLKIISEYSGLFGKFSVTAHRQESLFLVGNWSPLQNPFFDMTVTGVDIHGFLDYALLSAVAGVVTVVAALSYETVKAHLKKQI
ncbi:MAG: hypothetical protein M1422_00380 [Candidatus Thermoplasmatota archaeon]|nr:hypothetical protein [Candidatus Sysuiplasma jiujiangense]MCL4316717.1 hypothetical protein [Candidatus Thermoplasmatota archaeon]MCL5254185.1 hypothetical protein [Candidatus Thermoplasmatota archaeon]